MATITTSIDVERQFTVHTVVGMVTAREILDTIEAYYAATSTLYILWDFSRADLSTIRGGDIAALAEATKQFTDRRPNGKTALLLTTPLAFGLGRMFEVQAESQSSTMQYSTFADRDEALKWLFGNKPPAP